MYAWSCVRMPTATVMRMIDYTSRLVTQCGPLRGFRNPSGRGENNAIVIEAEPRSLLRHSRPDREGFKTEERLALVTNRLRKCY